MTELRCEIGKSLKFRKQNLQIKKIGYEWII